MLVFNKNELRSDEQNPLFDKSHLRYKCFSSDYNKVRYYTLLIMQSAPFEITDKNLLEQQISEMIKNAIKHGNDCDRRKKIHVWYSFSSIHAHFIVQDEGDGFKDIDKWNEFNKKRVEAIESQDFEALADFVTFRTDKSDKFDGGNALFAATEYWNEGIVFNNKKNALAMYRSFPKSSQSKLFS